jgi:dienelactone hydrolase
VFRYFPDNMLWSQSVLHTVNSGGDINEIERACAPLRSISATSDRAAWATSWSQLAETLTAAAERDFRAGNHVSARRKFRRSALYFLTAERMLEVEDDEKTPVYCRMRTAMTRYLELSGGRVEAVEVPYLDTTLPGYFVTGDGDGPHPTVVVIDGFDITRELMLFRMAEQAAARGISLLVMDTPGVGEALRMRGLTARADTEVSVGACIDYLLLREDVDPKRLGLIGVSLGGYYAGRAAAFERRIKATVLWGAIWDAGVNFRRLYDGPETQRPAPPGQLLWVTGAKDVHSALAIMDTFSLQGVVDKIEGPLLILHGAEDHVISPDDAKRVAVGATSARVTLHIRDRSEGGVQHCQMDAMPDALDEVFDWLHAELVSHDPHTHNPNQAEMLTK